jgi:hypothetical protein
VNGLGFESGIGGRVVLAACFVGVAVGGAWGLTRGAAARSPEVVREEKGEVERELVVETTFDVREWRVRVGEREWEGGRVGSREWRGRVRAAVGSEVLVEASGDGEGAGRAMRIRGVGERVVWGEGDFVERVEWR